ncbi:replication protein A 70 kDa DNA-binding subunit-like [Ylistrum balloti]|uniref:replication protein A 70 kDa DNA-binding subunit-like n=1 Tax=Ylistrum balloti TaxID=509963 RepID=UPI002905BC10|nr:replication protein A 70 kDa DNA-binding subunit-like [Ylistrum balloti]
MATSIIQMIDNIFHQAKDTTQEEIDSICSRILNNLYVPEQSGESLNLLRQLFLILHVSLTEPCLPKKFIATMVNMVSSMDREKTKECLLCEQMMTELLPRDREELGADFYTEDERVDPKSVANSFTVYRIQGNKNRCIEKLIPQAVRWMCGENVEPIVQRQTFSFLVAVSLQHRLLLTEGNIKDCSRSISKWMMLASLQQAPNPYKMKIFKKDQNSVVTEVDGTPSRNFFTVLNIGQYYTEDQFLNIYSFSLLYKWLHQCFTVEASSSAAESDRSHVSSTSSPAHRVFDVLVNKSIDYCFRILDQCDRKPKVQSDQDLQNACLLETVNVLDLVCKIDTGQISKVFQEMRHLYNRLSQDLGKSRLLLPILQFYMNHSKAVLHDPQEAYRLIFHTVLSQSFMDNALMFDMVMFLRQNLEALCHNTQILTTFFPNIFKILAWNPRTYLSEFEELLPALMSSSTALEVKHWSPRIFLDSAQPPPQIPKQESGGQNYKGIGNQKPNTIKQSPPANPYKGNANKGGNYSMKGSSTPSTPGSNRVHTISSLTPYQNRWRIRARITQKGSIRTWSNSRGEGKLFSVNFTDESGEIRATGFNEAVDKYYEMLEMNKVYYVSRGTLKTANKQYSNVQNDYEMTFNQDTVIEPCTEEVDLPGIKFQFVALNELDSKAANSLVDVIGVVKSCNEVGTVTGRQSQKEITKRDISIVDQSGMAVNLTLWGNDAVTFSGDGHPIMAVKGARLSDFGGRSLSVLASSQVVMNPTDLKVAFQLRSWFDSEGQGMEFQSFRGEGGSGSGSGTNWMTFADVKSQNIGGGEKADYFTSKGTVIFLRKENCMYKACPTESCNKKLIDQGNGMFRCEKCSREFPNFKWRMILSANLADFSDNQWVTCFQESAELLLGKNAQELGDMKDSDEASFDQVFQDAMFKPYIFKLRAKMETYNDETRLKTICVNANPINWKEYGHRLVEEINKLAV